MGKTLTLGVLILCLVIFNSLMGAKKMKTNAAIQDHMEIQKVKKQMDKLAPVAIDCDTSGLSANEIKALKLIVKAAQYMDKIFLTQVYGKNEAIMKELKGRDAILKEYFKINFGPFDRLNHDKPFINLKEKKPKGANFYPQDMTKKEFEQAIKNDPQSEKDLTSTFTLIRRHKGKLKAIPYSEAYKKYLEPAAKLMKEAAKLTGNKSLKTYLLSRAKAFSTNDYFQSDMDWMDLKDHDIELVIGPYEVYEDELFGYKAAFESFVTLVDKAESKKLMVLEKHLDDMERNLPIEDKYKNFSRGKSSPIIVANEVFSAGDTKAGIQTTAFNLPNDERVREAKGSKKVMLKNIAKAKFEKCWIPIVNEVLSKEQLPYISFDSYFNHVLMHEVAHGLGPGNIVKRGKKTTVNRELKDLYSTIEEAKADVLGILNLEYMIEKKVFPKELLEKIHVTYLGGIFRSIRFGINSAHGGGNAIQINYVMEKGGFSFDEKNVRFAVNKKKVKEALVSLAKELLMIEALGDYERAKKLIEKYKRISPQLKKALDKLSQVPVDIKPVYAIEKML